VRGRTDVPDVLLIGHQLGRPFDVVFFSSHGLHLTICYVSTISGPTGLPSRSLPSSPRSRTSCPPSRPALSRLRDTRKSVSCSSTMPKRHRCKGYGERYRVSSGRYVHRLGNGYASEL
jgi:hypothetical protein